MKVIKRDDRFQPLTILIETEEEARCIWHRLNIGDGDLAQYRCRNAASRADMESYAMFKAFNEVYRP